MEPNRPAPLIPFPDPSAREAPGPEETAPEGRIAPPEASGPHLSLAAIVGNEEAHIERFIQAFEPLVDEIVLVRAIGNQKPDLTFTLAGGLAKKPLLLKDYSNDANLDWPHVDSFAKARNLSFEASTGRFIIWADVDDFIEPEMIPKLRAQVELGNFDCLFLKYVVRGANPIMRERVMRRGIGRWVNAVHEGFSFHQKILPIRRADIEILHAPMHTAEEQPELRMQRSLVRNLKILEHTVAPAAIAAFYLHRDNLFKGENDLAIEWGKLAISFKWLTTAERYRVIFNLAKVYLDRENWPETETWAMRGIHLCPDRRECYCVLALQNMIRGELNKALVWVALARTIQPHKEEDRPNWVEMDWYGWRANYLEAYLLRRMHMETAALEVEDFEHGGKPFISLLHATRGRPVKATDARDYWLSTAHKPGLIEHIFAVDADDEPTLKETEGYNRVVIDPGGGCVRAWNAAAAVSRGKVLIQMSDDWVPPWHWDNQLLFRIRDAVENNKPAVLAISDGIRPDKLLCMAILTRAYYLRQREERTSIPYLFHPDYVGVYSDNEFTVRAYENGVVVEARDLVFKHEHAFANPAIPFDETYRVQNCANRYEQGLAIFNRRNPRYKIEGPPPAPLNDLPESTRHIPSEKEAEAISAAAKK